MKGILPTLFIVLCCALFSCKKNAASNGSEAELFGTWIKGSNIGDTIKFYWANNRAIMLTRVGYGSLYTEYEYKFKDGKLAVKYLYGDYRSIESFRWEQPGTEFSFLAFQMYMFISSSVTRFTYHKL